MQVQNQSLKEKKSNTSFVVHNNKKNVITATAAANTVSRDLVNNLLSSYQPSSSTVKTVQVVTHYDQSSSVTEDPEDHKFSS